MLKNSYKDCRDSTNWGYLTNIRILYYWAKLLWIATLTKFCINHLQLLLESYLWLGLKQGFIRGLKIASNFDISGTSCAAHFCKYIFADTHLCTCAILQEQLVTGNFAQDNFVEGNFTRCKPNLTLQNCPLRNFPNQNCPYEIAHMQKCSFARQNAHLLKWFFAENLFVLFLKAALV